MAEDTEPIITPTEPEEPDELDQFDAEVRTVWNECLSQLPDFDHEQGHTIALFIAQNTEILENMFASIQACITLLRQTHPADIEEFYPVFIELYMACTSLPSVALFVLAGKDEIFNRHNR